MCSIVTSFHRQIIEYLMKKTQGSTAFFQGFCICPNLESDVRAPTSSRWEISCYQQGFQSEDEVPLIAIHSKVMSSQFPTAVKFM